MVLSEEGLAVHNRNEQEENGREKEMNAMKKEGCQRK